ncbi:protein starmaker isoform X2 [Gossypium hirsutum]|uniref:Protein starmaker isoform X2 n=1 Tax=Gossypium hirsutum TaxID=3635 RepID=A0ABM3AE15_GOSHI|nr:protein starmaker-like isoform X2 [Gossypium hirsutum]
MPMSMAFFQCRSSLKQHVNEVHCERKLVMEQGKGRDTLRSMATKKKESSNLGKEKRVTCPSKPNASITTHGAASQGLRRPTIASLQGQAQRRVSLPATLPTHINKSTISTCTDGSTKTAKKIGVVNSSTKSQPQRPASAAPVQKPLVSSAPRKPTTARAAASLSSKVTATAHRPTSERLAKNPIAGKPSTLSSSSSKTRTRTMTMTMTKSLKKAPTTTTKRGTTTFLASKKPPLTKKDVQKENLDHQIEEVVKDEVGEVHDVEIPKAEESRQHDDQVEVLDSTHHVQRVEEEKEKDTLDDVPTVLEQHEVPQLEEMEEHDGDKENDSKEEVNDSDGDEEEVQQEETTVEAENGGVEEGYRTEEVTENGEEKGDHEGKEQELELVKEETIVEEANVVLATSQVQEEALHGEKETIEEEANVVIATNQEQEEALHGEKETIEEEANVVIATNQEQEEALHGEKETIEKEANVVIATNQEQEEALHGEKKTIEEEANVVIATNQEQEEALHGEKETIEEEANVVIATNQVQEEALHGEKEIATPIISDMVMEEKASDNKVVDGRKNSVRALIGAFETHK